MALDKKKKTMHESSQEKPFHQANVPLSKKWIAIVIVVFFVLILFILYLAIMKR